MKVSQFDATQKLNLLLQADVNVCNWSI